MASPLTEQVAWDAPMNVPDNSDPALASTFYGASNIGFQNTANRLNWLLGLTMGGDVAAPDWQTSHKLGPRRIQWVDDIPATSLPGVFGNEGDLCFVKNYGLFSVRKWFVVNQTPPYLIDIDAGQIPAWQALHRYYVGQFVTHDGGKIYYCDTAGTSGSTGPSGLTPPTDGTVHWTYQSHVPQWGHELLALRGQADSTAGFAYGIAGLDGNAWVPYQQLPTAESIAAAHKIPLTISGGAYDTKIHPNLLPLAVSGPTSQQYAIGTDTHGQLPPTLIPSAGDYDGPGMVARMCGTIGVSGGTPYINSNLPSFLTAPTHSGNDLVLTTGVITASGPIVILAFAHGSDANFAPLLGASYNSGAGTVTFTAKGDWGTYSGAADFAIFFT